MGYGKYNTLISKSSGTSYLYRLSILLPHDGESYFLLTDH